MSLLANVGRLFIFRVGGQILSLALIIFFTRSLNPEILGEYFYFESLRSGVALLSAFGVGGATEKFISEGESPDKWYSTGLTVTSVLTLAGAVLFLGIHTIYGDILDPEYLVYFILALVSGQFITFYRHIFRGELRASVGGLVNCIRVVVFVVAGVIAVKLEYSALGIIAAAVLARISVLPICLWLTESSLKPPSVEKTIELIHFAKYYFLTVVGSKVFYFADVILIGLILTKYDVGIYEVAWRPVLAAIALNGIIASTAFSYMSKSSSSSNMNQVSTDIELSLRYILIIPFASVAGSLAIGPELMTLLFTASYVTETYLLALLTTGFIFQAVYFLFSRSLVAIDKPKISFYATAVAVVANLSLNVLLIPRFGMKGAAFATTASFLVAAVTYYFILSHFVEFSIPRFRVFTQLGSACLMGISLRYMLVQISSINPVEVVLLVFLGAAMYFGLLLLVGRTRQDLFALFQRSSEEPPP